MGYKRCQHLHQTTQGLLHDGPILGSRQLRSLEDVQQFHHSGNGGVKMKTFLDILGDLSDGLMYGAAQGTFLASERRQIHRFGVIDQVQSVMDQFPDTIQEAEGSIYALITPVQILFRRCGK